jgi:drug/metabolite transporter (DMT)-like permease
MDIRLQLHIMVPQTKSNQATIIWRFLFLIFGSACGATAVIMVKASDEHPLLVASYRLFVAVIILLPFYLRDLKQFEGNYGWKQIGWSALPAAILAVHFMSWVIGARMTSVANASLIANLTPVAMPFFVWALFRERISKQEVIGTLFTLAGLFVLTGSQLGLSEKDFQGDLICFGSMLAFAGYLAFGRKNGGRLTLWLYMVPLYFIAGVICLLCALPFINPIKSYTTANILYILALGIIPTVGGHTILNYSLKFFRGQVVSVTNLMQPIFAGFMGYIAFKEAPAAIFYPAAVIIIIGVLIVLLAKPAEPDQTAQK